jgi:hypothetical protein
MLSRFSKPRCFLVYALAPPGLPAADANRIFNEFIGDRRLPLVLFHDNFVGQQGGFAVFYVAEPGQRDALLEQTHLAGWEVNIHPLVFSDSAAGFDDQIAWTLRNYRGVSWEKARQGD